MAYSEIVSTHHLGKLCEDPEELSGGLAVVGRVLVNQGHQRRQDPVDVIAFGFAVELLVVVERSLDLEATITEVLTWLEKD